MLFPNLKGHVTTCYPLPYMEVLFFLFYVGNILMLSKYDHLQQTQTISHDLLGSFEAHQGIFESNKIAYSPYNAYLVVSTTISITLFLLFKTNVIIRRATRNFTGQGSKPEKGHAPDYFS